MRNKILVIMLVLFSSITLFGQNDKIISDKIERLKTKLLLTNEQYVNIQNFSLKPEFKAKIADNKIEAVQAFVDKIELLLNQKQKEKYTIIKKDLKEELLKDLK